jgi:DNA-binding transcriptional regulator of glucitol operon
VQSRYGFLARPRWIALHLLCVALVVTMVLLGRWQLIVSDEKHFSLQNFGYALQWWAFSGFTIWLWVRLVRDHAAPPRREARATPAESAEPAPEQAAYRRYVMPPAQPVDAEADPVLAAYNDYLARLAEKDEHGK